MVRKRKINSAHVLAAFIVIALGIVFIQFKSDVIVISHIKGSYTGDQFKIRFTAKNNSNKTVYCTFLLKAVEASTNYDKQHSILGNKIITVHFYPNETLEIKESFEIVSTYKRKSAQVFIQKISYD